MRPTAAALLSSTLLIASVTQADAADVALTVAGSARDTSVVVAMLRPMVETDGGLLRVEAVDAIEVSDVLSQRPTHDAVVARIWIDLAAEEPRVILATASGDRILIRTVAAPAGVDEAVREQVVQIVAAAVDALRLGGEIGVTRSEAAATLAVARVEAPTLVPSSPSELNRRTPSSAARHGAEAPNPVQVDVGALYAVAQWSGPFLHSAGMSLGLSVGSGSLSFGAVVAAVAHVPVEVEPHPVGASILGGSFRWLWVLRDDVGPVTPFLGLGTGLDALVVRPEGAQTDAVVLAPEFTITTPVVTAWLGAKIPIRGRFSAVLGASLDVATDRDRFTASTTGGTVTIFDPSGVRFGGVLALLLELTP